MISNWLCLIGIHKLKYKEKWIPSFSAEIVTEYRSWRECIRCGCCADKLRLLWDADKQEMVNLKCEKRS